MTGIWEQLWAFTVTLLLGMVVGLFYDLYFVIRAKLRLKKWGTHIGDSFFWLITTALVFSILLITIFAELRFFVFLGLFGGVFLERQAVSNRIRKGLFCVIGFCSRFVAKNFRFGKKIFSKLAGKEHRM